MKVGIPEKIKNLRPSTKLSIGFIIFALIVSGILSYIFWQGGPIKTSPNPQVIQLKAQTNGGAQFVKSKDYTSAVSSYLSASFTAAGMGNYTEAKNVLEECIASVPDSDVPFYVYDSLANIAKNLNDKALEKDSVQKALAKAQQPGSGADSALISTYQQWLKGLGQ